MYSLVQSKLACTLEPRKEANKSPEYGEVFGWSRLLLSHRDDDEGGKGKGGGILPNSPYPRTRAYAHSRVYRKSSFASAGRGKTLMSTATSVDRITASEAQEGRNVYFKTCDSGPFLLFVGGIDQHWEDHAGPIS